MARLVGHDPAERKTAGLIPGQGTAWAAGLAPCQGMYHRQPVDVSFPLLLPPFPSL